jgi:outer membrane murein-binding lipoprotein Lpp
MKKTIITIALIVLASLTCLVGCKKNPEEKIEHAKENVLDAKQKVIEAKQDAMANYESLKMRMNDKITANELKIAALKVKAIDFGKKARTNYNEKITK